MLWPFDRSIPVEGHIRCETRLSFGRHSCDPARRAGLRAARRTWSERIVRIPLFAPRIAANVVTILFPEPGMFVAQEFQSAHPLRALPEIEARHHQPAGRAVVGRERAAVV